MKDAHCAELDFDEKTGLFGVFDGHGGKLKYLKSFINNNHAVFILYIILNNPLPIDMLFEILNSQKETLI